jgi:rhodanese-related sulfurtransferase
MNKIYIDVRGADEFENGSVPDAINVPLHFLAGIRSKGQMEEEILKSISISLEENKDAEVEYIVFCASGGRGMIACEILNSLGFQNVTNAGSYLNLM